MSDDIELDPTSSEVLCTFYKYLYPFKPVYTWLAHVNINDPDAPRVNPTWTNREFAFTLPGDIYQRYNSFQDAEEFRQKIVKQSPLRFEIGAVYNAKPRDKKTLGPSVLQPVKRELVFDIDMTDYDSIRTCCSDKSICRRCWAYITAAVDVLDETLRRDFGFELLLWVYSGRRGIHCWVSDEAAMDLTDEQRKSIMGWLEVVKGGKDMIKKVDVRLGANRAGEGGALPPSLKVSFQTLQSKYFVPIVLVDQDCFGTREGWQNLLALLPTKDPTLKDIAEKLQSRWETADEIEQNEPRGKGELTRSEERWDDLTAEYKKLSGTLQKANMRAALEDIVLQYTYPRIDAEVSKHRNHLLKAPFCVHPSTGRVCVPVDPTQIERFDPEKVPSVGQLLEEINELGKQGLDDSVWERTSLKPYVQILDEHNRKVLQSRRRERRNAKGKDMSW